MEFRLITEGLGHEIESILRENPARAYLVSAFITYGGAEKLIEWSRENPGTDFRLITGTYLDFSNPEAFVALASNEIAFRVIDKRSKSLHAKAYLFVLEDTVKLIIGSGNLTPAALYTNIEWSGYITEGRPEAFADFVREFEILWSSGIIPDAGWLENYRMDYRRSNAALASRVDPSADDPEPRFAQPEALRQLQEMRDRGESRALVVMATGLGKTHLAAFDSRRYSKVLYLAHRREILRQARAVFEQVRKTGECLELGEGWWTVDRADVLLATVQKLSNRKTLQKFSSTHFNYIIVDEFHHASAKGYRKVLDHFEPMFLLGLTATPFRMDRQDITALCDYNIPYSISFPEAIKRNWLCPFEYRGVHDGTINYESIPWRKTEYDTEKLENAASTEERASLILEKYREYGKSPAVAFCVSIRHADFMADYFTGEGVSSLAVHSKGADAQEAKYRVANGEIEVIFAVNVFNEGVDLPAISTVLFLRPTHSLTVFLQQFGRGLRRHDGKDKLLVLDFVGNYRKSFIVPTLLLGKLYPHLGRETYSVIIDRLREREGAGKEGVDLPEGCVAHFDMRLIDLMKQSLGVLHPVRTALIRRYMNLKETLGEVPVSTLRRQVESVWNYISAFGSLYDFYKEVGDLTEEQQGYSEEEVSVLRWLERKLFSSVVPLEVVGEVMLSGREWDLDEVAMMRGVAEEIKASGLSIQELVRSWTSDTKFGNRKSQKGRSGIVVGEVITPSESVRWDVLHSDIRDRLELRRQEFRMSFRLFEPYTTREITQILSRELNHDDVTAKLKNRMSGIIRFDQGETMLLFVTLDKDEREHENTMYADHIISRTEMEWESQNSTTLASKNGMVITGELDYRILLFVRLRKNDPVYGNRHFYMGRVKCISHEGERPIKVRWRLQEAVDKPLYELLTAEEHRKYTMPKARELDLDI